MYSCGRTREEGLERSRTWPFYIPDRGTEEMAEQSVFLREEISIYFTNNLLTHSQVSFAEAMDGKVGLPPWYGPRASSAAFQK